MELSPFCSKVALLLLLMALSSPCKFIQRPMDFGPLNILQATPSSSLDFGRMIFNPPLAVLRPKSPQDIQLLLSSLSASSFRNVTVSARGAGHSIHGQAQALGGIVVEMDSLPTNIQIQRERDGAEDSFSYADVSGGAMWIQLLEESLKFGLAPRSWTDYLYLTIGGTLSNGGISGQTFKYGPQISNVLQLDVITGNGELVECSPMKNSELFYAVLGGLGQFGIITRARILLQEAPQKVRWIRAFYDDFQKFTSDQELLISIPEKVDYVEGFMVLNEQSIHSSSIAFPASLGFISELQKANKNIYYCIEFAIHDYQPNLSIADKVVEEVSRSLSHMPSQIYSAEVSYFDFLNRVRMEELSLRERGMWDVPHPWVNMFVPKSGINKFKDLLMETVLLHEFEGPILIYPLLRNKWNSNSSVVLPDGTKDGDNVIYTVGLLRSVSPRRCPGQCLNEVLRQHHELVEAAKGPHIGAKQYLAHEPSAEQWRHHFGQGWDRFASRKARFDPLGLLSPGQHIFTSPCLERERKRERGVYSEYLGRQIS